MVESASLEVFKKWVDLSLPDLVVFGWMLDLILEMFSNFNGFMIWSVQNSWAWFGFCMKTHPPKS